jgi:hypothetical protein
MIALYAITFNHLFRISAFIYCKYICNCSCKYIFAPLAALGIRMCRFVLRHFPCCLLRLYNTYHTAPIAFPRLFAFSLDSSWEHFGPGYTLGWVDNGIRTTVRLGKVHFVSKVCKICLKTFLVHWPLPDRCTLLGPCNLFAYVWDLGVLPR